MIQGSEIQTLAFTEGGQSIVCTTLDGTIRTWKVAEGYRPRKIWEIERQPGALAFGSDGRSLFATFGSYSQLWDPATGLPLGPPRRHPAVITGMAVSPDGANLLTVSWSMNPLEGGNNPKGQVFRQKMAGVPATTPWIEIDGQLWSAAYTRGGRAVLLQTNNRPSNGLISRLYDADTGRLLGESWKTNDGLVVAMAVDPGGRIALTGSSIGRRARFWDFTTSPPTPLGQSLDHPDFVATVALDPTGSKGATGCRDGVARLWDASTQKPIGADMKHPFPVNLLIFSPDGKTLLTASSDNASNSGEARLWDATSGMLLTPPLKTAHGVTAAAFRPDGRVVALGDGDLNGKGTISIWDVPVPTSEDVERLQLKAQVETGLEMSEVGEIRVMNPETWLERKGRLKSLSNPMP